MQEHSFSRGPWTNPYMSDGAYEATIEQVIYTTYDGGHVLHVVFWIPSRDAYFRTNVYLPEEPTRGARMRVWHLFRSAEVELYDVADDARFLEGKTLRLIIAQYETKNSPTPGSYSDVAAFVHIDEEVMGDGTLASRSDWINSISDGV
jgi:hypothetical protein